MGLEVRSWVKEMAQLSWGFLESCLLLADSTSREVVQELTTNRKIMDLLERRDLTNVRNLAVRRQKKEAPDKRELRSKQEQMCAKNRTRER